MPRHPQSHGSEITTLKLRDTAEWQYRELSNQGIDVLYDSSGGSHAMVGEVPRSLIPLLSCAVVLSPARTSAQQTSNHHIKTVFIILMENKNWFMIKDNPLAPNITGALLPNASHTEVYFNPPFNHPSHPNYLWLEAGTNFGIYNDDPPRRTAVSAIHQK